MSAADLPEKKVGGAPDDLDIEALFADVDAAAAKQLASSPPAEPARQKGPDAAVIKQDNVPGGRRGRGNERPSQPDTVRDDAAVGEYDLAALSGSADAAGNASLLPDEVQRLVDELTRIHKDRTAELQARLLRLEGDLESQQAENARLKEAGEEITRMKSGLEQQILLLSTGHKSSLASNEEELRDLMRRRIGLVADIARSIRLRADQFQAEAQRESSRAGSLEEALTQSTQELTERDKAISELRAGTGTMSAKARLAEERMIATSAQADLLRTSLSTAERVAKEEIVKHADTKRLLENALREAKELETKLAQLKIEDSELTRARDEIAAAARTMQGAKTEMNQVEGLRKSIMKDIETAREQERAALDRLENFKSTLLLLSRLGRTINNQVKGSEDPVLQAAWAKMYESLRLLSVGKTEEVRSLVQSLDERAARPKAEVASQPVEAADKPADEA